MDISLFRQTGSSRLILQPSQLGAETSSVHKSKLPLADRFTAAFKKADSDFIDALMYGTAEQQQENRLFKIAFYHALIKAEGIKIAECAVKAAGLPTDWLDNPVPLSARRVKKILNEAESYRMGVSRANERSMQQFITNKGENSFLGVFEELNIDNQLSNKDVNSPLLQKIFEHEVKRDSKFAHQILNSEDLKRIAFNSISKFYIQKEAQFKEAHPHLAEFANRSHLSPDRQDLQANFYELERQLLTYSEDAELSQESKEYRHLAYDALDEIKNLKKLVSEMTYEPEGWKRLTRQLSNKIEQLTELQNSLNDTTPATNTGKNLSICLVKELDHQKKLLDAKKTFVEEVAINDPFSEKALAYHDLLWAHAAEYILQNAQTTGRNQYILMNFDKMIKRYIREKEIAYQNASTNSRIEAPTNNDGSTHPVLQCKTKCLAFVRKQLKTITQLSDEEITRLTGSDVVKDAWRKALNNNQEWAIIKRTILAHKDGVDGEIGITRRYQSVITPGKNISKRFEQRLTKISSLEDNGPDHPGVMGISSATTADHYHARNLKVSQLNRVESDGTITEMATVIGHGVIDSWDISDAEERKAANERAAKEVLEAGLVTNNRIRKKAENGEKVKMTHVSVNLTTPAGWRELPYFDKTEILHDFQEQTYTNAQFEAFENHSGHSVQFQLDNPDTTDVRDEISVDVDVDVIAFSFAINPLATGKVPDFVGGWSSVYDRNYKSMQRFIGNLGTTPSSVLPNESRVQDQPPGGFIGSVIDQLADSISQDNSPDTNEYRQKLIDRLQQQTNIVRNLFLSEAFKRGHGDPAKMGREILALQALAEEALNEIDSNEAATASKGCKSDKDRGGVTDVEFKFKLITEDMGGEVIPDAKLEGNDQTNYNNILLSSGQLEIQEYNTGLRGSKETGKLTIRIPNEEVQTLASGLSRYATD